MKKKILEDKYVRFAVSAMDGSIMELTDVQHEIQYIQKGMTVDAFRVETEDGVIRDFREFSCEKKGHRLILHWMIDQTLDLHADISLHDGELSFWANIHNRGKTIVKSAEWPILGNVGSLGDESTLIHPFATGILIRNPLSLFTEEQPGIRHAPYPESFSGASMQFFAYYGNQSGMILMAKDADGHQKWLNFYKNGNTLEATHRFGYEHLNPGNECRMDYIVSVQMFEGDWYDAADLYKAWAVRQPFTPKKTVCRHHPEWLYREVGLATFGINSRHDRTLWLKKYHDDLGLSIFHILGPDWPAEGQDFKGNKPGGLRDWFPTAFNPDNLRVIRENGDYWAPFEFDFLVATDKSNAQTIQKNLQVFPTEALSIDDYSFTMLCPATAYTQAFHRDRDVRVWQSAQPDAFYYDISANNLIKTCVSDRHDHDVGGGKELSDAYNNIYEDTKNALASTADTYVPLGAEMINEYHLNQLDYYQARAWAQPASTLEFWPFREWLKSGRAEIIPLFSYVYHEYGAVRLDGWGKLVDQLSDIFYLTVAKTYLWGGLYEINHEYSPMETIDDTENGSEEHYASFDKRNYAYNKNRMAYIKQFAMLRSGVGNAYLSYGEMIKPPVVRSPRIRLNWFHYNHTQEVNTYNDRGCIESDAVICAAYRSVDDDTIAVFLSNVDDEIHTIPVSFDANEYAFYESRKIILYENFSKPHPYPTALFGYVHPKKITILNVTIDAKRVVMLRIVPMEQDDEMSKHMSSS